MEPFVIDPEACTRDGLCVQECPARIIRLEAGDPVPVPRPDFSAGCIACGHCVAVCPTGAFRLGRLDPADFRPRRPELQLSPEQAEHFLRGRRSIRSYEEAPVERSVLARLIEASCWAPSAKNAQPWHWTIVENPAEARRLAGLAVDYMRGFIREKPKVAELLSFTRVVADWERGCDRVLRGAPHVIVVHIDRNWTFGAEDTALALSYLELYAPVLGLGTCWAGYFYMAANAHPPLFEALGIPPKHKVCGAVMVGRPRVRYRLLVPRRPPRIDWR